MNDSSAGWADAIAVDSSAYALGLAGFAGEPSMRITALIVAGTAACDPSRGVASGTLVARL